MGTRIAVMDHGVVQQLHTPMNLYDRPDNVFVAGFIGSPAMNFLDARVVGGADNVQIDAGCFKVSAPPEKAAFLKQHLGEEITFGIRPEHIKFVSNSAPHEDGNTVQARAEVVEPLGREMLVHLRVGAETLEGLFDIHSGVRMDQDVLVSFDMSKMHGFDLKTGKALGH